MPGKVKPTKEVSRSVLMSLKLKRFKGLVIFIVAILISIIPAYQNQVSSDAVVKGIMFPDGEMTINFDFPECKNADIKIPYRIENFGYVQVNNIEVKVILKMQYQNKFTGNWTRKTLLSKVSEQGHARAGQIYKNTLEYGWEDLYPHFLDGVNPYLEERMTYGDEALLMDVEISMYLVGVEMLWLLFSDVELYNTSASYIDEEEANGDGLENEQIDEYGIGSFSGTIHAGPIAPAQIKRKSYQVSNIFIWFGLSFIGLTFLFKSKKQVQADSMKMVSKDPLERYGTLKKFFLRYDKLLFALFQGAMLTVIYVIWDHWNLAQVEQAIQTSQVLGVNTGDYLARYALATNVSVAVLSITWALSLVMTLGSFHRLDWLPPFTLRRELCSLLISIVFAWSFFIWTSTAVIAYNYENTIVIRDSSPSYLGSTIVLCIGIFIKLGELGFFYYKREDFALLRDLSKQSEKEKQEHVKKLKSEQKLTYKSEEEFIFAILRAVESLTEGSPASEGSIIEYFTKRALPRWIEIVPEGDESYVLKLELLLESLVSDEILAEKEGGYVLSEAGNEWLEKEEGLLSSGNIEDEKRFQAWTLKAVSDLTKMIATSSRIRKYFDEHHLPSSFKESKINLEYLQKLSQQLFLTSRNKKLEGQEVNLYFLTPSGARVLEKAKGLLVYCPTCDRWDYPVIKGICHDCGKEIK